MNSVEKTFTKDPQSTLDYQFDWSDWLSGDVIASSVWEVTAGISTANPTNTPTTTTVFLSGGAVGVKYIVTNRITTSQGRTEDRRFQLNVVQR